mmetsp:Transcript_9264/g.13917  ORF Transcript_9264/g.13917 Transcript_9264/m.13917 type:complete len:471 (-) Transcript_9264:129-1541(-)
MTEVSSFIRPSLNKVRSLPAVTSTKATLVSRGKNCSTATIIFHKNSGSFWLSTNDDLGRCRFFSLDHHTDKRSKGYYRGKHRLLRPFLEEGNVCPFKFNRYGIEKILKASSSMQNLKEFRKDEPLPEYHQRYQSNTDTITAHHGAGMSDMSGVPNYLDESTVDDQKGMKSRHHRRATTCDEFSSRILDLPSQLTYNTHNEESTPQVIISHSLSPFKGRPHSTRGASKREWDQNTSSLETSRKRSWIGSAWKWATKRLPSRNRTPNPPSVTFQAEVFNSRGSERPKISLSLSNSEKQLSQASDKDSNVAVESEIKPDALFIPTISPKPYFWFEENDPEYQLLGFEECLKSGIDVSFRDRKGRPPKLRTLFLDEKCDFLCWLNPGSSTLKRDASHSIEISSIAEIEDRTSEGPRCLHLHFSYREPIQIKTITDQEYNLLRDGLHQLLESRKKKSSEENVQGDFFGGGKICEL